MYTYVGLLTIWKQKLFIINIDLGDTMFNH